MASITHKFLLNDTVREDGTRLVMLRMTYDRKHRYTGTGVHVADKFWNPKGDVTKLNWVRSSHAESVQLNLIIKGWNARLLAAKVKLEAPGAPAFTVVDVKNTVDNRNEGSVSEVIEAAMARYKERKQWSMAATCETLLVNLRKFLALSEDQPVLFSQLSRPNLERFETYLLTKQMPTNRRTTDAKRRNTTSFYLNNLRRHLTAYVIKHKLQDSDHPMRGWELETANVVAPSLTDEEIMTLLKLDTSPPKSARRGRYTAEAVRDFYCCSFGLQGIRVGDLLQATCSCLSTDSQGTLMFYYVSEKRNLAKHLRVEEPFATILRKWAAAKDADEYIFPFLKRGTVRHHSGENLHKHLQAKLSWLNRRFRLDVAEKAGITRHLTLHSARHSFGDAVIEETSDMVLLQAALGHSDIQTTQRYAARRRTGRVNKANVVYSRFSSSGGQEKPKTD